MITPLTNPGSFNSHILVWTRDGRAVAEIRDGGGTGGRLFSDSFINDGEWHHLAVVFRDEPIQTPGEDDGIIIFINGEEDARTAHSDSFPPSNPGAAMARRERNDPSHYFEGTLSEVHVWDRALDEAEIQESMEFEPASIVSAGRK